MYHRVVTRAAMGASLGVALAACVGTQQSSEQQPGAVQSSAHGEASVSVVTPQEQAAGWRPLLDGKSTAGWRGYKKTEMPSGWQVVNGALTRVGQGGDIITSDQFGNFELALDWNVAPGGNSGIFYRVTEEGQAAYETGPEMQVLDDARHVDGHSRLTAAGSLYGIYAAPPGVVKPAGEWNAVRIAVNGNHVEHWLNGVKVVDYELGSPDWEKLVAGSKFKAWPGYGRAKRGHIALQDHGDWVAYRNIKIKVLP
jgi:3-keto-disaccharide hydrolase